MHTINVPDHVKQTIGKALGRVPSGVFILTTQHEAQPLAMMASWVQQASFVPPAVSVAVAKDRPLAGALRGTGATFALSVLGDGDMPLMKKYARGIPPGADPFDGVKTRTTPGGSIVLADALAYLECRVKSVCDFGGDHDIYLAEVTAGELLKDGHSFMHVRGNGFHY
jgi:3-hydroxy-9,10-secoandrosta-1,3,5(10)-triene-9,17-dione monooxygenase reductase component